MSDLNQLIRAYKENPSEELRKLMAAIIERYEFFQSGPACCFWVGKLKDLSKRKFIEGYIKLDDFKNYAEVNDDFLVGCSRGCISYKCIEIYSEKLCRECVDEAKKILKIK
jgi:hypothetical protein